MAYTVVLEGGSPWGFRLDGGLEFKEPLRIAKINSNSKAYNQGIQIGDRVDTINGRATHGLPHHEALQLIRNANKTLTLQLEKQKGQGKSLVQRSTGKQITKRSHTQPIPTIRINGTSPPLHGTAPEISGYLNGEVGGHRFHSFSQKGVSKPIYTTSALDNHTVLTNHTGEDTGSSSDSASSIVMMAEESPAFQHPPHMTRSNNSSGKPSTQIWSPTGERKNYSYKPVKFSGAAGASTSNGSSTSFSHTNGHHVNTTPSSSFSQSSTFSTNSIASTSTSSITTSSSSSVTSSHRSFDDTDLRPAHSTTTTAHTEPVNTTHPVAELQMHNAVYSNQGRPFSPGQGRPFSPNDHQVGSGSQDGHSVRQAGPGRPFSPSRQDGPSRPFSPVRHEGPGRPFSPSRQDGPGRPFSPTQRAPRPFSPNQNLDGGRPFSPSRQGGQADTSGVAISKPFPGDQRLQASQTSGPALSSREVGSPKVPPKTMPKPVVPPALAEQLGLKRKPNQQPQMPDGSGPDLTPRYPHHQPMMGTQYVQKQKQQQQLQQPRAPVPNVQHPQPRMGAAGGAPHPAAAGAVPGPHAERLQQQQHQQQQQQRQPPKQRQQPQQQQPPQQQQYPQQPRPHQPQQPMYQQQPQQPQPQQPMYQQQPQQPQPQQPMYQQQPQQPMYQQQSQQPQPQQPIYQQQPQQPQPQQPQQRMHQPQPCPSGGAPHPGTLGQGSHTTFGGTVYRPKTPQQQLPPQQQVPVPREPMWMWSMKDMLPLNVQQNREFAPYSMPASPTSPGPDQWAAQPYSLPTSPTPMSEQNLAPPEDRTNAASPVRQMAALFDNNAKQTQGSMQFIGRKRMQPWKKPMASLSGQQFLNPLVELGRSYSPTRQGASQQPQRSAPAAQPTSSHPRVLSPTVDSTPQVRPSRVLSPTRQIQQVPSSRVTSPTQQLYAGAPQRRVLSPPPMDTSQQQQSLRVLSPTRQLNETSHQQPPPPRVFSPTRHLQPQNSGLSEFGRVFSPTKQLDVTIGSRAQPASAASSGRKTPVSNEGSMDRRQPYMLSLQPPSILKQSREDKVREANKRIEEALSAVATPAKSIGVHFSDSTSFSNAGPVNRPITPYSHEGDPWKNPASSIDRPVTPLDRPTTPYEGLRRLFDRPTTPYDRPITPYGQTNGDRPTTPIYVQVDGFDKPPSQRPVTPLDRPTTPVTNPLVRPTFGKDRPTTPFEKPAEMSDTKVSRGKWAPVATMLGHQDDETNDNKYKSLPHTWSPAHGASQPKKDYRPMHVDPSSMDNTFASRAPGHTTASNTVTTTTTTTSSVGSPTSTSYTAWNGTISHFSETKSGLPQSQSPTITLLQKSREGQIPKGAIYVGTQKSQEGGVEHTDMYYMAPAPEETVVEHRTKEVKAPRYKGIGPVDKGTGMPVGLRTSVDEKSQKDWYKNMYKSLHKTDKPTEVNTYKPTYQFPESDGEKEEKEEPNPYKPSYEFPSRTIDIHSKKSSDVESGPLYSTKSLDRQSSRDPPKKSTSLWSPAHARYKDEKYRNQPLSITDYEPGFSSIAFKEARSQLYNPPIEKPGQFSRYVDNDTSNIKVKKLNRSLSPTSDFEVRKVYKEIQKGGDVPIGGLGIPYPEKKATSPPAQTPSLPWHVRHTLMRSTQRLSPSGPRITPATPGLKTRSKSMSAVDRPIYASKSLLRPRRISERSFQSPERRVSGTDEYPRSPANTLDRRRRDEENARRRDYMEQMFAEEKRRRMAEEVANNEARRHSDWFTPSQKSPIPSADRRFDEGMDAAELARPTKKASYQVRGKCKALYNFTAQNPRELSFRKGDIIYLTRMIDSNWYEGEHHGRVGIFPENHVEIVTSLETATAIALKKEGTAVAKYNFNAQTSVEMSLRKGDVVHVIRRIDENWFEGRHGDRQGIFPSQYVDIMKEPETPLTMTPMSSLAPTPAAGSPSQLSPCSTISNGPAPTIPDAPLSPFSSSKYDEQFDWLNHQFEQLNSDGGPSSAQTHMSVQLQQHSYRPDSYGGASTVPMPPSEPHRFQTQHQVSPQYSAPTQNGYGPGAASSAPGSYQSLERKKRQDFRDYESRMSTGPPPGPATKKEGYGYRKYKEEDPIYPRYRSIFRYMPQNEDELELQEGDTVYVMEKCDDGWFVGTSERTKEFGTFPGNYVQPL